MSKTSNQEYWLCEGVPCKIEKDYDDIITIKPFNIDRCFHIEKEIYNKHFVYAKEDDEYVYCDRYPSKKIEKKEFDITKILKKNILLSSIKNITEYENFKILIDKAYQDAYYSKGSTDCINMTNYKKYKLGDKVLTKLEKIGDPVFNRSSRHSPPIYKEYSHEDFSKCESFPAPIGITYEDFALPSEQNIIFKELLEQLFNSLGAPECPDNIKNFLNLKINKNTHKCRWCNELINMETINQKYCSSVHSINFCHIDPLIGTKKGNIYIGHCDCNREQGGYSEEQRILQVIRLLSNNKDLLEKHKNKLESVLHCI